MNLKKMIHRMGEEIYSTTQIVKVIGFRKALWTLKGKFDIQLMVHNGHVEYKWIKKDLLKKHAAMNEYFLKSFPVAKEEKALRIPLQNPEYKDCIWICWWQGLDQAPDIVKKCIDSIKNHAGNHKVVLITDKNYASFITFPEWINEKYEKGIISKTHLSDLLRITLLAQYGGVWLDSTFFCTGSLEPCFSIPVWTIKRPDYRHVSVSCGEFANYSLGCTSESRMVFAIIRDYLLEYWRHYNYMIDYLFLDYLIVLARKQNAYVDGAFAKVVPNNKNCDELLKVLSKSYDLKKWETIKQETNLFKLTWKTDFPQQRGKKSTYYGKLLRDELY